MSFALLWPLALAIFCNVFYQIFAKGIPENMDVMASMVITYLTGAVVSLIMYFVMNHQGNILQEMHKMNAAPILLGVSVVGIEVGLIYAYKVGWPISVLQMVQSVLLALILIFVGAFVYHEEITVNKIIGIMICLIGLYFINC